MTRDYELHDYRVATLMRIVRGYWIENGYEDLIIDRSPAANKVRIHGHRSVFWANGAKVSMVWFLFEKTPSKEKALLWKVKGK